ncbi:MAG: DUF1178 family protein [Hyphomonadaceae bacterium]|nr:DUF1178 family protein [Hyphomonadaceae bacterium]
MCPFCESADIKKAIMAPGISTSRKKEAIAKKRAAAMKVMNAAADKIRREIADNCDYVGKDFTDEARAIHYGEKPERGIYGEATLEQAAGLKDEGIGVSPLPDILAPKPKSEIN